MFLYEYAVIRLVPLVEREEFINVGIIIFSKKEKFIRAKIVLPEERLKSFKCELDLDQVKANLRAFELISSGAKEGGPIACEELPERFRWLTAVRSSIIQTSRPHPGKTNDLEKEVERLFVEYVG
ncbi:MAG: hypothetical protein K0S23_164 [Fluviicola sp.]|jgi:hypothetical protein|uniref:DUF3037 domain-containing protein n=1 Tax=Fluviicola sp. TaxID=1917219 RepID=UPI0026288AD1|nr:DUF3037 domain-containing protein [Fluviicola sp.]MDF3025857.1 hypothetical protein [Fluviicola sp.]